MSKLRTLIVTAITLAAVTGVAYASFGNPRQAEITDYRPGHEHMSDGTTVGAPRHSGGTDKYGCHNASVPYHCH